MSITASRLKIFEALTAENPPPIPLTDETVILSDPVAVPYDPRHTGNEDYYNTRITVTARPGSGYTGSVDVYYTRNDLIVFEEDTVLISEYPYTPQSLVDELNRRHGFTVALTVDDLETITELSEPSPEGVKVAVTLRARIDSMGWIGKAHLNTMHQLPPPKEAAPHIGSWYFEESMVWNVKHNLKTRNFIESIRNISDKRVYAYINILSDDEFQIEFTEPEAGWLNVMFLLNA